MTVYKGTHITKFDSTPREVVDARLHGGVMKMCKDSFEIVNSENNDDVILFRLPIDAVIHKIRFACDALTSGTIDVGVHRKAADGTYVVVDADAFASAIAVSSAVAITDVTNEAAAANIDKMLQPLWQRAGLSTRPTYNELYISLTTPTGTGATGTVYVEVEYTE